MWPDEAKTYINSVLTVELKMYHTSGQTDSVRYSYDSHVYCFGGKKISFERIVSFCKRFVKF